MLAAMCGVGGVAVALSARAPMLAVMAIGAAALALIVASSGSLVLAIVFMSGSSDLLGGFNSGSVSPMGGVTVLYALCVWFLWLLRPHWSPRYRPVVAPFVALIGWGLVSVVLWYRPTIDALQNLFVLGAFVGLLLVTARDSGPGSLVRGRLSAAMGWASALAGVLFLLHPLSPIGPGLRSFAIFALIGIGWYLAGWRCGSRRAGWAAVVLLALIAFSLSRTALAVGLFLIPLAWLQLRTLGGWLRLVLASLAALLVLYVAVLHIAPLRSRFFEGDMSLHVFGVGINAEGRVRAWRITWESYREAPLLGHGAGSSEEFINRRIPGLNHPHNDYLRLLHDYGLIGAACWGLGYLALLRLTWRGWLEAEARDDLEAGRLHLAAFLALSAVALVMLTDNAIVYIFVMAPLGVLAGASLGALAAQPERDPAREPVLRQPARADRQPMAEARVRRVA
jgi:hypothetical protein